MAKKMSSDELRMKYTNQRIKLQNLAREGKLDASQSAKLKSINTKVSTAKPSASRQIKEDILKNESLKKGNVANPVGKGIYRYAWKVKKEGPSPRNPAGDKLDQVKREMSRNSKSKSVNKPSPSKISAKPMDTKSSPKNIKFTSVPKSQQKAVKSYGSDKKQIWR